MAQPHEARRRRSKVDDVHLGWTRMDQWLPFDSGGVRVKILVIEGRLLMNKVQ